MRIIRDSRQKSSLRAWRKKIHRDGSLMQAVLMMDGHNVAVLIPRYGKDIVSESAEDWYAGKLGYGKVTLVDTQCADFWTHMFMFQNTVDKLVA